MVFTVLFGYLAVIVGGCSAPSGEDARRSARDTVETLFVALAGSDDDTIRRIAPELAEAVPGVLAQIAAQLSLRQQADIGIPEITGRRAVVPVTLTKRGADSIDDAASQGDATLLVPLRWRRGGWQVDPTLTISQTFDIIRFSD